MWDVAGQGWCGVIGKGRVAKKRSYSVKNPAKTNMKESREVTRLPAIYAQA